MGRVSSAICLPAGRGRTSGSGTGKMIVLRKGFNQADKGKTGKATLDDLNGAFQLHSELGAAWNNILAKNDGGREVTYEELLTMFEEVQFENLVFSQRVERNYQYFVETMVKNADKNETGTVSAIELKEVLLKIDPEDKNNIDDKVAVFKLAAEDGNQQVKMEDALQLLNPAEKKAPKEKMRTIFRICDTDEDGYITKDELADFVAMVRYPDEDDEDAKMLNFIVEVAFWVDQDGDEKLNYFEFCLSLTTRGARSYNLVSN